MFGNNNLYLAVPGIVILGKFPVTGFVDIALPINDDNNIASLRLRIFKVFYKNNVDNNALNPPGGYTSSP